MTRKNWIILAIIGLSILLPFIFWLRLHRFDWIDYSISEGSLIAWGILAGIALLTRTILYIIVTTVTLGLYLNIWTNVTKQSIRWLIQTAVGGTPNSCLYFGA